jgi:hypothetical protein
MKVSIVIVTWNSQEDIEQCLESVDLLENEVIVVDNHSEDRTVEIIREKFPRVKIIRNLENSGYAHANNQGMRLSGGDYILLLNPDTIILNNAIKRLANLLDKRDEIGAVAPQLLSLDGRIQPSCREFPCLYNIFTDITGFSRLARRKSKWQMGYFDHKYSREVDQPMTSCLLIRREIIDKIGFMDERYPFYMNDVDFLWRIKKGGYKVYFLSDARVIHKKGASTDKCKDKMVLTWHFSMIRYLILHFPRHPMLFIYIIILLAGSFYRTLFYKLKRALKTQR